MADIERVQEMEKSLNDCVSALQSLNGELEKFNALRERMIRLFHYYGSEGWYQDREGELPADVPAGVLSEAAVYDLITDVREAAFRMLETGTDILKNRI